MSYFIFLNNQDDVGGTLCKIAENQNDLNNLNIILSDYKIIEDSQVFFDAVKYRTQDIIKYSNNLIISEPLVTVFQDEVLKNGQIIKSAKEFLNDYIITCKNLINLFLKNNNTHPNFKIWSDYYDQLNSLDLDSIEYPLNYSLEQYFKNQNLISLNPLQLP